MKNKNIELQKISKNIRKLILETSLKSGGPSHIGGALSISEIMCVLYFKIMKFHNINKDRFILSKGHGFLALLTVLYLKGFINKKDLFKFQKNGSDFIAHPIANPKIGIESSNGSLGQGLSFGIGISLAYLKRKQKGKIFVLLGDGECYEGSVWEAAITAAENKLNNLFVIIDCNGFQNDGPVGSEMSKTHIYKKWKSFGWNVKSCDGHNFESLIKAFEDDKISKPTAIVAETVKGMGIKFMENNNDWHHNRLTNSLYEEAIKNLGND